MTKFLFLFLVFLIACTPTEEKIEGPGQMKVWEPITSIEDNERVNKICDALRTKESMLNVLASSSKQYTFSFAQKNCNESKLPDYKLVPTVIKNTDSGYVFSSKNGEAFGFRDVETSTKGAMKAICEFGGTLQSPVAVNSKVGLWWTTYVSSKDCGPGFGNLCIHLMTGNTKDGTNFKIHSEEWIKFKVMDANEGFFLERKLISSAGCEKGKTFEMRAVLK